LRLLVTRPGALLRYYCDGRRVRYVPPLTLFLTLNLVFFIVAASGGMRILAIPLEGHLDTQSYSPFARNVIEGKIQGADMSRARFADRFDAKQGPIAKGTVILMVPTLAFVLWPMMPTARRKLSVANVFSLHTFAFLLLFLSVFGPLWRGFLWVAAANGLAPTAESQDDFLWFFLAAVVSIYLTVSIKNGLMLGWTRSVFVGAVLTLSIGPMLLLYRLCVFLLAAAAAS
jgi:hypothetical protein